MKKKKKNDLIQNCPQKSLRIINNLRFFLTSSSGDKNLTGILTLTIKSLDFGYTNTAGRMGAKPSDHLGHNISAPNIQLETPPKTFRSFFFIIIFRVVNIFQSVQYQMIKTKMYTTPENCTGPV